MTSVAPTEYSLDDDDDVKAAKAAQHTLEEHALAKEKLRRGVRRETTHKILLSLPLFIALVITALYTTYENVDMKNNAVSLDNAIKSTKQLSRLTLQLQRERDQLVLYNHQIGVDSKTYLVRSYAETDRILSSMTDWPIKKTDVTPEFSSKRAFHRYIIDHRIALEGDVVNVKDEVLFYARVINKLIEWLHDAISKIITGDTWQFLVSYQKIVSATEDAGVVRAIGTTYFADGYFRKYAAYKMFNQVCGSLVLNYEMARKFASRIPPLKQAVNQWGGYDVYTSVNLLTRKIQVQNQSMPSVEIATDAALNWLKSYLYKRSQHVSIDGKLSKVAPLQFGVPKGSLLGPKLYTLCTKPLGDIIRRHRLATQFYADAAVHVLQEQRTRTSKGSRVVPEHVHRGSENTAATWFDSMSAYVDTLLDLQTDTWEELIRKLNEATLAASSSISFSGSVTTVVCALWPGIVYFFYWNEIECGRTATAILKNAREVAQARRHDIAHLSACLPRHLVALMKANVPPPQPAYVPMMTMIVVQAVDLHGQSASLYPHDVISVLGELMQQLSKTAQGEMFMLTQENDRVLITAENLGLGPQQEARTVVDFALDVIAALRRHSSLSASNVTVAARIGVQTGSALKWISGLGEREQPSYRVSGEPVFAAQKLAETAEPNSIRVGAEVMALMDADEEYEFEVAAPVDVLTRKATKTYPSFWIRGRNGSKVSSP
ncbi:hypothetical protein LSAT2_030178 [Lamellibrachia satsuma]|nr:hypothetical protein LSAT2_030178 [Lamellibrachia satsuma]